MPPSYHLVERDMVQFKARVLLWTLSSRGVLQHQLMFTLFGAVTVPASLI